MGVVYTVVEGEAHIIVNTQEQQPELSVGEASERVTPKLEKKKVEYMYITYREITN